MKVKMIPTPDSISNDNGIGRVVHKYFEYLPQVGIELVEDGQDLTVSHGGAYTKPDVLHHHGFWWRDYANESQHRQNAYIVEACRNAISVVVPSDWVAQSFMYDMRLYPHVVPHAIEFDDWQLDVEKDDFVLWNKNRSGDACDPQPVIELANRFPKVKFVTTFLPENVKAPSNIFVCGRLPFDKMKSVIAASKVYLATTKETFGIGTLEAMACGTPILGFRWGSTKDIVTHKKDGYLSNHYDYDDLAIGLQYLLDNDLSDNARKTAQSYTWLTVAKQLKEIYEGAIDTKRNFEYD